MPTRWCPPTTRPPATTGISTSQRRGDHGQQRPAARRSWDSPADFGFDPTAYLNFIRNPDEPFLNDATLYVNNYASFTNTGVRSPGPDGRPSRPVHPPGGREISGTGSRSPPEVDPTTGLPRLIVGNHHRVYSGLDNNGTFETDIGSRPPTPSINRNGNLQLAQFYYGAAQPSSAAAQAAGALFYGGAENIGGQSSDPAC